MGRIVRWAGLVVLIASIAATAAGCKLDVKKIEDEIRSGMAERTGVTPASVTCPQERRAAAGDRFTCEVRLEDGTQLTAEIVQNDDRGNINWNLLGVFDPPKVAETLAQEIAAKIGVAVTVDCGRALIRPKRGATFECAVHGADGRNMKVRAEFGDDEGGFHWEIVE